MSQSEQQLTSEEREALPGFAAPIPRRVQKKADERHNPWGWLQGNKPFFLLVFRVACAFGVLSFFLGNFLGIVVWLTGCFVLGVGFAILILPQSLQGHFWHRALARTGIAVMGVVTERDGVKEIRRGPGLVEVIYFTHAYQFQTQAGETVRA